MKTELNKQLIESLGESNNTAFLERVNDTVYNLLSQVVSDISQRSAFVRFDKCILIPVNEIYLGDVAQLSTYDYFLGIENPEIEMNTKTRKNFWRYVWREFRASWRLGKKKYKKQKEQVKTANIEKYQLSDFRHDIVKSMTQYLTETSLIYEYTKRISLVGKDDFGSNVKINIYVCIYDSNNAIFKMYSDKRNKFAEYGFGDRFENLDNKKAECGDIFVQILKIFNAIYSKKYNRIPNQILLESLVWNCPKLLFDDGDVFRTFVNVANFIRLAAPKSIKSICDPSKHIFEEKLILGAGSQTEYGKIINMLDDFKY